MNINRSYIKKNCWINSWVFQKITDNSTWNKLSTYTWDDIFCNFLFVGKYWEIFFADYIFKNHRNLICLYCRVKLKIIKCVSNKKKFMYPISLLPFHFVEEVGPRERVYLPAKVWQYSLRSTKFQRLPTSDGAFPRSQ